MARNKIVIILLLSTVLLNSNEHNSKWFFKESPHVVTVDLCGTKQTTRLIYVTQVDTLKSVFKYNGYYMKTKTTFIYLLTNKKESKILISEAPDYSVWVLNDDLVVVKNKNIFTVTDPNGFEFKIKIGL